MSQSLCAIARFAASMHCWLASSFMAECAPSAEVDRADPAAAEPPRLVNSLSPVKTLSSRKKLYESLVWPLGYITMIEMPYMSIMSPSSTRSDTTSTSAAASITVT